MSSVKAGEFDLLNFFGVEPERPDPDAPWPYNDFTYAVVDGDLALCFTINPAGRDIWIELKRGAVSMYRLHAVAADDLALRSEKTGEVLEIGLGLHDVLWLRIKPSISIDHRVGRDC
jgi:hypothetical protein